MSGDRKIVLNFYRAYYDVMMSLSKRNRLEFIEYVLKVSFFDAELEPKPFNNRQLNNAFCIIYGQLLKQQNGYKARKKDTSCALPYPQGEEKEQAKLKDKSKEERAPHGGTTPLSGVKTFMGIKEYLEENAFELSERVEFIFEERLIKVSKAGRLYDAEEVDDLITIDFDLETRALKYLLRNKGILK